MVSREEVVKAFGEEALAVGVAAEVEVMAEGN